jgi:hypothetical protein
MTTTPTPEKSAAPDGDPREFRWILASRLHVDQRHQRECNPEKVAKIANEFDWLRFEALTVARGEAPKRGGAQEYVVVEGQHRALALQQVNLRAEAPCMVLPGKDVEQQQQSQIAYDIQFGRKGHSAYEQWRLRYNAGHPHEIMATAVMDDLGVRVGKGPSAMTIGAVATVRRIVHGGNFSPEDGAELLRRTLTTIIAAFPTYDHQSNVSRWDRSILLAIAQTWLRWPDLEGPRLARSLQVRPASQWVNLGKGSEMPTPDAAILAQLVNEYNRNRRRGRLQ